MIDLNQLTVYLTQIVGFGVAIAGFWRYCLTPGMKAVRKVSQTSEELTKSLPILLELAGRFSDNGRLVLPDRIQELQDSVTINTEVLRVLGNKLKLCWYKADVNGNYVYISNELTKLMNITLEQSLGNGWKSSICDRFKENVIEEWNLSVQERREFDMNFAFCQNSTHKEILINSHSHVIKNDKNEIIGFIGVVTPADDSCSGYQN